MVWLLLLLQLVILFTLTGVTANLMAKGTRELEKVFGKGIAGGVILGFVNSLPETIIVLQAIFSGIYSIAISSVLGGNILLFTIGLGFVSIFYYMKYSSKIIKLDKDFHIEYNSLLLATFILIVMIIYGKLDLFLSFLLIIPYAYYIYKRYSDYMGKKDIQIERKSVIKGLVYLLVGSIPLIFISKYFILTIINVSQVLNIPTILLTLILTPIVAELEESLTAIRLISNSPSAATTAIMNFMGSKLENMTILLSIIGLTQTVNLKSSILELLLIVTATVIALGILRDNNIKINEGLTLFGIYATLVTILIRFSA
ncbi:MAG: sodium:calcium antiporter [Saccharolobus sp.]